MNCSMRKHPYVNFSPFAGFLSKDRVYWNKIVSCHINLAEYFGLTMDEDGSTDLLAFVIHPPLLDYTDMNFDGWKFRLSYSQRKIPSWYEAGRDESRVKDELKLWASYRYVQCGDTVRFTEYYLNGELLQETYFRDGEIVGSWRYHHKTKDIIRGWGFGKQRG